MSDVFSKVADEMGVKRTFSELVPEEPWAKHIELMAVPDCHLLYAINTAGGKFNDGITIILFMTKVRLLYSTMANINNFLLIEKNNLFKRIFGDISGRHFYDDVT